VTPVTRIALLVRLWALLLVSTAWPAQAPPTPQPATGFSRMPAEALYLQLGSIGLDPAKTYKVRGASIDRPSVHITLDDGEISFTREIQGRITGAFFQGEGEVLLTPPTREERASMALFTGMAILEESFATAYFRFNDETFAEIQPFLRPADDAADFATHWTPTVQNLAEFDALRLLADFSRYLPTSADKLDQPRRSLEAVSDRMLHARIQGERLGAFDLVFDRGSAEHVWAGQTKTVAGETYYDLWTSFPLPDPGKRGGQRGGVGQAPLPAAQSDDFENPRYRIKAEVRPPTSLSAEAYLQLKVLRGGQRMVLFELSRFLQVKEVDADGTAVEFIHNPSLDGTQLARRGNDQVAVIFPDPLRDGQILNLRFVYGGDVLSEAGGGLLYVGARGTWYPNRGIVMADFDLEFHYPSGWTLAATGNQVPVSSPAKSSAPEGEVSHWVTDRPTGLAGFNLGRYERELAKAGDVSVVTYAAQGMEKTFPRPPVVAMPPSLRVPPRVAPEILSEPDPSPARNARAVAQSAAHILDFYSQRFGPYPYGSLQLTQMPGRLSQGWPGLVFLSSYAFLNPGEQAELHMEATESNLVQLVLPHEIAHQWWGDLVGWRTYRDQWLMEGLANYCALMTIEAKSPTLFRKILEKYRTDLLHQNSDGIPLRDAGPVTLGLRLSSSHFPLGYEGISYGRGTWLFHMLREMLLDADASTRSRPVRARGSVDEPFVRALHKIRARYVEKEITTAEFFESFEQELPPSLRYEGRKSLDWFVEGWVNGVAMPRLSLQNVKYAPQNGGTLVSATILQKEAPPDLVTSVPIFAIQSGRPILLGRVFADGLETTFHLTAPSGTKKIVVDPNQSLLTEK
jgi:Peptidase family M1 domain